MVEIAGTLFEQHRLELVLDCLVMLSQQAVGGSNAGMTVGTLIVVGGQFEPQLVLLQSTSSIAALFQRGTQLVKIDQLEAGIFLGPGDLQAFAVGLDGLRSFFRFAVRRRSVVVHL